MTSEPEAAPVAEEPLSTGQRTQPLATALTFNITPLEKKSWREKYLLPLAVACLPASIALAGVLHNAPVQPSVSDYCKTELAVVKEAKDLGIRDLAAFDDPQCPFHPTNP